MLCNGVRRTQMHRVYEFVSVGAKIALLPLHCYAYSILIQRTCHSPPCDTNKLEPPQVLDADLHFVSSSLVRRQPKHKKLRSPDMEALIETVGRAEALAVRSLYRELISWRDLCALFQVCRVSEGATLHSTQSRLLHIWSGSFRVTCTHTHTHTNTHINTRTRTRIVHMQMQAQRKT